MAEISKSVQHQLTPWVQLPETPLKIQLRACSSG